MAARLTAYIVVGIVAATLIAGLIVGAQRDDNDGPVDIIVHNAKVYTADRRGTMAEAVAIRGNQILRVGTEREVNRLRRPQTTLIDAKGATVIPGFNDAHVPFVAGGLNLNQIDLTDAETLEEIQSSIKSWADLHAEAAWIVGRGWYSSSFPAGMPTRQQLDAIVPDRPAQIVSQDGRTSWVNTRALRLAGITRKTANPPQGTIFKDQKTGEPLGVLKDAAVELVNRHIPKPTEGDVEAALRAAIDEAHRNGITSVQDPSSDATELALYADARREGDLLVRVYAALSTKGMLTQPAMAELDALAKRYPDDPLLKAGAISIALDGTVGAHAAALLEPYANDTTTSEPAIGPDDLNRMIRELDARGWQVLTTANGDRAVQMALNAYEHAVRSNPLPERGRRHRVEGAQMIDAADLQRFSALGVIASMQPYDGAPSSRELDAWSRNVGPERSARAWPYGSVSASAGRLAFGSGWPAAALNPMLGLHTAVNRTTADNLPEGGWDAAEHLALKAAIDAYTSGAAWASFDEQRKGTLAPGMLADLVVLSENIFDAPTSRLASTRVAVTIFDGKVVYQRDGKQTTTN